MVFERNRYLQSLWVYRKQQLERIKELCSEYDCQNIWNMDESGCFFKALLSKGMTKKGKKAKGDKKWKQRVTVAFFVSADGGKVEKPVVFWKSKNPYFRKANAAAKCNQVSHFSNSKSRMEEDIMENVLEQLNHEIKMQSRRVILFMDNATVHPKSFLPKNTTSFLQSLDASIIKKFKLKYRKKFMRYVLAQIVDEWNAYEMANEIDVIQGIEQIANA